LGIVRSVALSGRSSWGCLPRAKAAGLFSFRPSGETNPIRRGLVDGPGLRSVALSGRSPWGCLPRAKAAGLFCFRPSGETHPIPRDLVNDPGLFAAFALVPDASSEALAKEEASPKADMFDA
jgi:hypothetical protein